MRKRISTLVVACVFSAQAMGCVSARVLDEEADRAFRSGDYSKAAARLEEGLKEEGENGNDRLLYLLDLGLTYHQAGEFDKAIKAFQAADRFAEVKDYTKISEEVAAFVTNDNMKVYKGEDFENVMISTYLAMDYALKGDREGALVEARRVNSKLYRMVNEGKRKFTQNAFARYLSSILYESDRDWNSAYVDLKKTLELTDSLPGLGRDLWRVAWLNGMREDLERWEKKFNLTAEDLAAAKALHPKNKKAEIIVLFENGISPMKVPHPNMQSIPTFRPRYNPVTHARVQVDGKDTQVDTFPLFDVQSIAIQNLQENYDAIIAKKMAKAVTREIVTHKLMHDDRPGLAALVWIFMAATDQADLRSWQLLPKDLQIARITVDPGVHTVLLNPVGAVATKEKTVSVSAGGKVFVGFRTIP
ncbi:MAG: hypothetical protein JNL01_15085 [Bdellovibrionales bacterium]|nr:hypothetical protein [Bdellovibrionales bacterium]